ncbi:hypothetical protein [Sideroxyarcus emersonii]|uniref:hypothetical protein n=1 Tax=Sideroxyarcus emersonii TaxID=2764705 RepID=UPI001F40FECB|nr:hypothetical protein [Sideroxyarcus emersonii]
MKKPLHILALLLFALIQCFAPLVHAHVDGIQTAADSFHAHDIPRHVTTQHSTTTGLSQYHFESYESQAISIPHEHPRDDTLFVAHLIPSSIHPHPPHITISAVEPNIPLRAAASPYRRPHPQAPPHPV